MGFCEKNLEIFQNRYMWQFFSRMRLEWSFFLKMSFYLNFEVSCQKSEKKIKIGKVRKYEETEYFEKKRFQTSKRHP